MFKLIESSPTKKKYKFTMDYLSAWFKTSSYEVLMLSRVPVEETELKSISKMLLNRQSEWKEKKDKPGHYSMILEEYPKTTFYIKNI